MISLDQARKIIAVTREKGRAMALKPLSVCVLDAGGHVLAFEREDGASPGRYEIAHAKAYGAAGVVKLDWSNVAAPSVMAIKGVVGGASATAINNGRVYVAAGSGGLSVLK